jgi:AcrR family transcriptional regulator
MPSALPAASMRQTMDLLWRSRRQTVPKRGPRARVDVDAIVSAAIRWADDHGMAALSMRVLAAELGVGPMTLYSHVPDKATLTALMIDQVYGGYSLPALAEASWSERVRAIADANYRLHTEHAWMAQARTEQPPLGPGTLGKYEAELGQLTALELADDVLDSVLTFVVNFARSAAVDAIGTANQAGTNEEWWVSVSPFLQEVIRDGEYPLASRVGSAAGAKLEGAYNVDHEYRFGLDRVIDAVAALRAS